MRDMTGKYTKIVQHRNFWPFLEGNSAVEKKCIFVQFLTCFGSVHQDA
jgi:hypothetical protein